MKTITQTTAAVGIMLVLATAANASDCGGTSIGQTPINDLGSGLYLGLYEGGLYPGGLNVAPSAHGAAAVARAIALKPLDTSGNPAPDGRMVLLSIGMSNTTQEFCSVSGALPCNAWTFMGQAAADPAVNQVTLTIANGARGGQAAGAWESPTNQNYDRIRDDVLAPQGLTEAQVVALWVKVANARPTTSLPDAGADALDLEARMGNIMRAIRVRYPNAQLVFLSSRIYAGYASSDLNPEPYAYESAFSCKWLIEAQINQMAGGGIDPVAGDLDMNTTVPWIGWAAYLWADGLTPRSDGLTWVCSDFESDGTHPATAAEQKVGTMLLDFFLTSPFTTRWFRADGLPPLAGDVDGDCDVDLTDLGYVLTNFGTSGALLPGDLDGNGTVTLSDLGPVLATFGGSCP